MRARDRNSYINRALRELMRAQRPAMHESPFVALLCQRMLEASYQALRFKYRMSSTWDIFT